MQRREKAKPERALLVIHGGAGVIHRKDMSEELEQEYRQALLEALMTGFNKLQNGCSSLDAVEASVCSLENCPLFNAGKGAVFTDDERIELDAAIMDGRSLNAGAVASLTCIKNPILVARAVMEQSPHVLLIGEGANQFARTLASAQGWELVDKSYFWTKRRYEQLKTFLESSAQKQNEKGQDRVVEKDDRYGTVGAVALDAKGNLAAATSTGGLTGKKFGRLGDTPIIGAGTYADNRTCAVSCTGDGEFFMRNVSSYDLAALIKYRNLDLAEAANIVIHDTMSKSGGKGGLIAIDAAGNFAMPYNSEGMYRGVITESGDVDIRIFAD